MKKILLSFLAVFLIGALVISCDSNAKNISDETATVSFATSMGRTLTSSVNYTDFSQLAWYYKAIAAEEAKFTHGQKTEWEPLSSLSATVELSQGFWTFNLQARVKNGNEVVFEGNKSNVLIKKQATPIRVEINVSPVAGGNGSIVLSDITIKGKKDVAGGNDVSYPANKAVVTNKDDSSEVFNLDLGTNPVTQLVSAGNYSVKVSFEENEIVYGEETLDITVYSGSTVTISGNIAEGTQSAIFNPSLEAPETIFAKQLPVTITTNSDETEEVKVSTAKEIKNGTLVVTYPEGTLLKGANVDAETNTADAVTGVKYVGDTLSEASLNKHVSLQSNEGSVAHYQLTLNVADKNSVYLTVNMSVEKNLAITRVLHNGVALYETSEAPTPDDTKKEYYSYNKEDGILTLYVFHASPIEIITAKTVIVTDVTSLKKALDDGALYIALGNNIDLKGSGGSEQVNALNDTTIDLNGYTLNGSIWSGSYLSSADGTRLTLVDSRSNANNNNNGGKIYSKFRFGDGGAMMQANAVTAWQHAVTINSGVYLSNNVAVVCQVQNTNAAEGVIINGGYFGGTEDLIEGEPLPGPVGGCVSAVIGTVTINGGTFKAAQYGSVITAKSGSSKVDTVVNINDGTFEGACMFDFGKDHSSKTIVNVYGGDFTVKNPDGSAVISETSFAYDNVKHAALVNNDMFKLNIMGGTFNYDPSAYVDTANYKVTSNGSTWTVTAI